MKKKKRAQWIIRAILLISTAVSLYFVPWALVLAWLAPLPDTIQDQVSEALGHGFDGIIVYVDEAGKPPAYYAAGWHEREKNIPANPQALFKIGSIGKLYDAAAVTKLVSNKQLSLDGTLADYFSEFTGRIENADSITLRMMVQHRSGIPNLTNTPDFWVNPPKSSEEALERIFDLPANFEPGKSISIPIQIIC